MTNVNSCRKYGMLCANDQADHALANAGNLFTAPAGAAVAAGPELCPAASPIAAAAADRAEARSSMF